MSDFLWNDPFLLTGQLTDDERMILDPRHHRCREQQRADQCGVDGDGDGQAAGLDALRPGVAIRVHDPILSRRFLLLEV